MKKVEPVIQLMGEINTEAFAEFSAALQEYEIAGERRVHILLNSGGGTVTDALAFASRIRISPCDIIITAIGEVVSAAVIILAYGSKRRMTEEAWVMVHEESTKLKGELQSIEREAKHLRRLEDQWAELLAGSTGTSKETWSKLHKATTYLNAAECKALGLVDEII